MKNNIAIIVQLIFTIILGLHRFIAPMGSDFMFGILLLSLLISAYLLWQIFKVQSFVDTQKIVALICAFLPLIWLFLLLNFIS